MQKQSRYSIAGAELKEGQTSPPKHYNEDLLLSAMQSAGADSMEDDVERTGIGTPATRAATIEKLVQKGFLERKGDRKSKILLPTEKGRTLVTVMPEQIQSPEMTADWENKLLRIERGEMEPEEFMTEIKEIISSLVNTTEAVKGANALTMSCSGCRTAAWCRGICAKTCGPRRNTVISDEAVPAKRAGLLSAYAAEAGCRPCAPLCIHALSGKAEHCSGY